MRQHIPDFGADVGLLRVLTDAKPRTSSGPVKCEEARGLGVPGAVLGGGPKVRQK